MVPKTRLDPPKRRRASKRSWRRADGAAFAEDAAADGTGDAKAPNIAEAVERGAAVSAAGAVTLGHGSVVSCVFAGDARRAETAAAAFVGRVTEAERASAASRETSKHPNETPERDASAFAAEIKRAFVTSCDLRDVAIRVPGAPAPLFAAKRLEVVGPVVQARAPVPKPAVAAAPAEGRTMTETDGKTPRHAPVATFTDVDVRSTAARVCYAVHCEPALVSFARELLRLTPPPRGGRDAAAARVAAAWRDAKRSNDWRGFDRDARGPRKKPRSRSSSPFEEEEEDDDPEKTRLCAPSLPFWDVARSLWRGKARVFCADVAATLDADAGYFSARRFKRDFSDHLADHLAGRSFVAGGCRVLEVSASKAAFDLEPGVAAVKVARLAFAAKGGLGFETGEEAERTAAAEREPAEVPAAETPSLPADVQLAVIPAAEFTVEHRWRTLGGGDGGDFTLSEFGSGSEAELFRARFAVGVDLAIRATLTTKDAVVRAWREAERERERAHSSFVATGRTTGTNATAPREKSSPVTTSAEGVASRTATAKDEREGEKNERSRAANASPSFSASPIARWLSGDFEPAITSRARSPRGDHAATRKRSAAASPRSPSADAAGSSPFATVSSAAAASVADASTTPTLIAGPASIRWARDFLAAVAKPRGGAPGRCRRDRRRRWRSRSRGTRCPRPCRECSTPSPSR